MRGIIRGFTMRDLHAIEAELRLLTSSAPDVARRGSAGVDGLLDALNGLPSVQDCYGVQLWPD